MKLLYLPLFIILTWATPFSVPDPIDKVAALVRQGNIRELSKSFADNIEVTIFGDENICSSAQAELILEKFFSQNSPKTVRMLHKVNSNPNFRFGVLVVGTGNGTYRVTFTLKEIKGKFTIIEFRIEKEKG